MKKKIAILMLLAFGAMNVLAGCGGKDTAKDPADMTYAVEAGSAGVATENGWKINAVASQADALMEVASGTSDAAIIDLLMAGAMIGEGTSYPNLTYTVNLNEANGEEDENYVVGFRKGSDLTEAFNNFYKGAYKDGIVLSFAQKYGVQEALVEQPESTFTQADTDSDVEYIKNKGTFIVGITEFAPMDYKDDNGEWIGFDADMAKAFAESIGVEAEFLEINWNNKVIDWDMKIMELNSKNIDAVWNGMTLTNEVTESMDCTNAYCNNAQVVVVTAE